MEEVKRKLEEAYGFRIYGEETAGSRTELITSNGAYYLFTCSAVHRHKRDFLERARKHIAARAGVQLLPVLPTTDGQTCVVIEDDLYYLQPAVREAGEEGDVAAVTGRALAAFHQASAGFSGERLFQPYRFFGGWPGSWRKKLRRYELFRDDVYEWEDTAGPFDEYLLKNFTYVHHLADTAVRYLTDNGYHRVASDAARRSKISYQNFDDGYVVQKEDGSICLAGTWDWVMDMRARDVGQWIKAQVRRNGWQDDTVHAFLEGYNSISPLLEEEYAVVYGLMMYPGRYLRLVDLYLGLEPQERSGFADPAWEAELDAELARSEEALRRFPRLMAERFNVDVPQVDWLWRRGQL